MSGAISCIVKWGKVIVLVLFPLVLSAQKTEIMLVKHLSGVHTELSITDREINTVLAKELTSTSDTLFIRLEANKEYFLHLNDYRYDGEGDPLISLYVNGVPVIVAHSDIKAGDHIWPFYTGMEEPNLRIVGGTSVSIQDYPWQVFITAGDYLCGGTIIADKWVLTAAHCLFDDRDDLIPVEEVFILAGSEQPFEAFPDGEVYEVALSVVHEDYYLTNFESDLALLRTTKVIDHEFARPLNLITLDEVARGLTSPGTEAIITGYGITNVEPLEFPDYLQKIELPIVSNSVAQSVWGPIPFNFLMAGYADSNQDACRGDSGGPLVVLSGNEYKLAGVTSWGSTACNSIGGYTRVSYYLDWLIRNTGVGQNQFATIRPVGDDFRCENLDLEPNEHLYISDTLADAIAYEWRIEPSFAGDIQYEGNVAYVKWSDDFVGEAYVSARALTDGGYTNWAGQRVQTTAITNILSQPQDTSLCINSSLRLEVGAEGSELIYNWFRNGILIRTGDDPTYFTNEVSSASDGIYYTEVIGRCGTAITEPFEIDVLPMTEIISFPDKVEVVQGEDLEIDLDIVGDDLSYTWYKDDIPFITVSEGTLFIEEVDAATTGLYKISVSGTCGSDDSYPIHVFVDPGIEEFPEGINIWPTLTYDEVNISVSSDEIFDVYVYNSKGLRMGRKTFCRYNTSINLAGFAPDYYILQIRFDREIKTYKVVKL